MESRVQKSVLNAKVNLIFYFAILILSFFSRRIFLDNLGADFIGFTGTLSNLLGFLNLAELGIASAIGYVLYQPLFDGDQKQIIKIISVFGYLYKVVGLIILTAGCILSLFLTLIFPNTGIDTGIIYFAFFSYLTSSLIGYFANYKQTLLAADQRNYIVTAYFQSASIVRICIQMIVAYKTKSYFGWILIDLCFGIIHSIILNWKINKVYPWLKTRSKDGRKLVKEFPQILKFTRQLFIHKIAGFIQFQTNPFIIYAFTSLSTVAAYGNYMMIINNLLNFVNKFLGSTEAAIGNLIASKDSRKILNVFYELTSLRYFIAGMEVFGLFAFSSMFISLWVGEEFVLSSMTVNIMIVYIFLMQTRGTNDQFIYGYGLFGDIWAAFVEMGISLGCAITLGYFYGLPGVISGGVIGMTLIVYLWKPYYLFSRGFKIHLWHYWKAILKLILLILLSSYIAMRIKDLMFPTPSTHFLDFFVGAIVSAIIYGVISFGLFYLFDRGTKFFVNRLFSQILKRGKSSGK
jgi:O-antigen/teichoic acid export membrane protein